jgi:hypothetical protein
MEDEIYQLFLKRLERMLEFEWNNYDLKISEEYVKYDQTIQIGVRKGENSLQAIARNMTEVLTQYLGDKNVSS